MERLADTLDETVTHVEGTVTNLNSAAKLLLSRHVRSLGTKVCLTGEGATSASPATSTSSSRRCGA